MKTLDEVIKGLEENGEIDLGCVNCVYADCCGDDSLYDDTLHYLKEYRSDKAMWESDRKGFLDWIEQYKEAREKHQQAVIELKKNPPLSWDELKTMEGKPVWATFDNENGTWYIAKVYDDEVVLYECGQEFGERISGTWDYTPKRWQAYRKERE